MTTLTHLDGLTLASHPTERFTLARHLEATHLEPALRDTFDRPAPDTLPQIVTVYVDPEELHFRCFENILPLDRLLESLDLTMSLRERTRHAEQDIYTFALAASTPLCERLLELDTLGLSVPPLNSGSRGGRRFIFHSATLAVALTASLKEAMPRSLMGDFSHVNPVFRYNTFAREDAPFSRHVDTPYYDAARDHVSRYTLLLYLTGGQGEPALSIEDAVSMEAIEPWQCVVFDQRLEHEGAPFVDGDKIFIRTELIFHDPHVEHHEGIAQLFSKACYMTGAAMQAPELERYMHDCYDRVAAAHWTGLEPSEDKHEPYLHVRFRGVDFIANGYDFWFPRTGLSLEDCAVLTLLDYFNATLQGASFRSRCESEVISGHRDASWIPEYFANLRAPEASPVGLSAKHLLLPPPEDPDPDICCPFHAWEIFDPLRCADIVDLFVRAQRSVANRISQAPILLMGEEIYLDPERIRVEGDKIYVQSSQSLTPINFAACWNAGGSPPSYVGVETTVETLQLLVPPILFTVTNDCYHLMFDFFRNSWMVKQSQERVPVPRIALVDPADAEDGAIEGWLDAVEDAQLQARVATARESPWWGSRSDPWIAELYEDS